MVLLLLIALALGVVAAVAVLVIRDQPVLTDDPADPRALRWPPEGGVVSADDLAQARFTVALRGYRMDEVDRVLADVETALTQRDARIAELEADAAAASAGDESVSPCMRDNG